MTVELVSATTLIKDALGTSPGLVNWAVNTTAEAAFDRHKILRQFVEDEDREGAVKWLREQRFASTGAAAARGTDVHTAAEQYALGVTPEVNAISTLLIGAVGVALLCAAALSRLRDPAARAR